MSRFGVLLVNIGTPDAPTPKAVGRYLREFLMDARVLDLPYVKRWLLVNLIIVPLRRYQSAKYYQKIHSPEGSPLLVHTRKLAAELTKVLNKSGIDCVVEIGMRYGNPSIEQGLKNLRQANVDRVIGFPLYPQYAQSTFETAEREIRQRAAEIGYTDKLSFIPPFYADPAFLAAAARSVADRFQNLTSDHLVFSFHGLPVRHIKRLDTSGKHCLMQKNCCEQIGSSNEYCYRAHCVFTARAIAKELGLEPERYAICFQSRFGRAEWIGPNLVNVLRELPSQGVKNVSVFCPSFVADCLETLEEVAIRGRATFVEAGGAELTLIPSLNSHPAWVEAAAKLITRAVKDGEESLAKPFRTPDQSLRLTAGIST